jgi:hypothetical protein
MIMATHHGEGGWRYRLCCFVIVFTLQLLASPSDCLQFPSQSPGILASKEQYDNVERLVSGCIGSDVYDSYFENSFLPFSCCCQTCMLLVQNTLLGVNQGS